MKHKTIISVLLPILFVTSLMIPLFTMVSTTPTVSANPGWLDNHWAYRRVITISPLNPENFQIKVVIPSDISTSDYPSIRFLENETSGVLPYWIEKNEDQLLTGTSNIAWVRRLENDDSTIYMYYHNASAKSAENGDNVFMFFDDFGGGTGSGGQSALNTNKWGSSAHGVDVYQTVLRLEDYNDETCYVEHTPSKGMNTTEENTSRIVEFRIKDTQAYRGGIILTGPGWGDKEMWGVYWDGSHARFFGDNYGYSSNYLQTDVYYIGRMTFYGATKSNIGRSILYGNDNANYRQQEDSISDWTGGTWNPEGGNWYFDTYRPRVWDGGGSDSYYFDWFIVRKFATTDPVATVGHKEIIPDNIPPTAFNLLTPENNATTTNTMPTLTWENSSDSWSGLDHYEVWLDGNNVDNMSDIANVYTVFPMDYGTHNWYIVAVDAAGNKQQSDTTFTFTILDSSQTISDVPADAILLRDNWAVNSSYLVSENGENISTSSFTPENWYHTFVPSTVLSALVRNGVYPNPYVGTNNMLIPDSSDNFNSDYNLLQYSYIPGRNPWRDPYWYRTKFFIPDNYENKQIWLNFNGINYRADVWLNGTKIADNEDMVGMFRRFNFNITDQANVGGNNYLAVMIHPVDYPGVPAPPQTEVLGSFGSNGGDKTIGKNVTMQSSAGWDWIPNVPDRNMGIWQDVYISTTGPVDIRNPHVTTDLPLPSIDNASVTVSAELVNATDSVQTGVLKGLIGDNITFENDNVGIGPGETVEVVFAPEYYPQLVINNPRLWWPNTYGEQYLYELSLSFENNNEVFDNETTTFGVREVSSELSPLNGRIFYVNGQRVFLKGGAWVPDMMLNQDSKRYDDEIRLLAEANNTIVRVWGGGVTPPDEFFEACDKYGLLVWQEFWITGDCNGRFGGSSDWPLGENLFLEPAIDVVKRIRNHPSLLVWVGGNEYYPRENIGVPLRDNILAELDGTRPFLSSSDGRQGNPLWDNNNPGVYSGGPWHWLDSADYFSAVRENEDWTFKDETGSPSLPPLSSLIRFIPDLTPDPTKPFPLNNTWGYHDACENNTGNGEYGVYHDAIKSMYGSSTTLADYVLKAQLVNADVYRAIFEAANHRMWDRTSGVMLWKANSAWPSVMWQLYDWYLEPNAGYYYAQNSCEPLHVQLNDDLSVYVINTYHEPKYNLTVTAEVYDLNMNLTWENTKTENVAADCYTNIFDIVKPTGAPMYFVRLELENSDGELVSRNFYWRSESDNFTGLQNLPTVNVVASAKIESSGDETIVNATLMNTTDNLAFFICMKVTSDISREEVLPTYWNSNYFSLLPGESRNVTATFKTTDLEGDPVIELSGMNVPTQELEVPSKPILFAPADGTSTSDSTPTFTWTASSNADNHRLLVDNDPDFSSPEENVLLGASDNSYTLTTPLSPENYSWKVIAINDYGLTESSVWTFIENAPAGASISFVPGWNLVCFAGVCASDIPNSLFAPLVFNTDYIMYFWNAPGGPYGLVDPTKVLKDNTGYWVDMITTTKIVSTTGTRPASENIHLVIGWNLVGFAVVDGTTTPNSLFAPLVFNTDYIMYFWNAPGGPYGLVDPTKVLKDNAGYWVDMITTAKTVTIP